MPPSVEGRGLTPRDLFHHSVFRDEAMRAAFYQLIADMKRRSQEAQPSRVNQYLATIAAQDRLVRNYSQNIDGLEEAASLRVKSLIVR